MEIANVGDGVNWFRDNSLVYFDFAERKGDELQLKISCECGGSSETISIRCLVPSDPTTVMAVMGCCNRCQQELKVLVYFYVPELLECDETSHFNYYPWRGLDLPVRLLCDQSSCQGVSRSILVPCIGPGFTQVMAACQKCQATIKATVHFVLS